MTRTVVGIGCVLTGLVFGPSAGAWNEAGHHIVAAMAYEELPDAVKSKAAALLKEHPDFKKWKKETRLQSHYQAYDLNAFCRRHTSLEFWVRPKAEILASARLQSA